MSAARKYRKKPVEVEAAQWDGTEAGAREVMAWIALSGRGVRAVYFPTGEWSDEHPDAAYIVVRTLEGNMLASSGDYVIRGAEGEHYPCKPAIFAATYDEVAP